MHWGCIGIMEKKMETHYYIRLGYIFRVIVGNICFPYSLLPPSQHRMLESRDSRQPRGPSWPFPGISSRCYSLSMV